MTIREKIRNIYPTAIIAHDTRNYGSLPGYNKAYIVIDRGLKNDDGTIELDFVRTILKYKILSEWCATEELAWKSALIRAKNKFNNLMEE